MINKSKTTITFLLSLFLICTLTGTPKAAEQTGKYFFNTPEKAWDSLLSAMQANDFEGIKHATTNSGYGSLTSGKTQQELGDKLKKWSKSWVKAKTKWKNIDTQKTELFLGPEIKAHCFRFINSPTGWKLDLWLRGH